MWKIHDLLQAKFWAETLGGALAALIITAILTFAICLNHPSVWVVVIGFLVCASLVAFVSEMRYRMHIGKYGLRGYEIRTFDHWLENNSGRKIDEMNFS